MSKVLTRQPAVDDESPIVSLEPPRQRRVSLIVLGGLVVVIAALVAAWLVASAGESHRVLVAGTDLTSGQLVTEADLRVVEIGGSLDVPTIGASEQSLVVGKAAAGDIPAGTVIHPALFINADEVVPDGMVIVGAVLKDGQLPLGAIGPGEGVNLISTVDADSGETAVALGTGIIYQIAPADSGGHWVSVLVPTDVELTVAAAAAAGELRLAVVPK